MSLQEAVTSEPWGATICYNKSQMSGVTFHFNFFDGGGGREGVVSSETGLGSKQVRSLLVKWCMKEIDVIIT